MKHLYFLILTLPLFSTVHAQQKTFSEVYYDTSGNSSGNFFSPLVVQAADNGYILSGSVNPGLVLKIDSAGHYVWSKLIGGQTTTFNALIATHDSCFVLAGSANELLSGSNGVDMMLVKINSNGDTLWSKTIGSNNDESALSIQETSDHGFIIAGVMDSDINQSIYVVRLDSAGNIAWSDIIGDNNYDVGYSIKQASDGNFILIGSGLNSNPSTVFMIKISSAGSIIWSKQYPFSAPNNIGFDIELDNDSIASYIVSGDDVVLMKTDTSGNVAWSKIYIYSNINYFINTLTFHIHKTSDGGYVFYTGGECEGTVIKTNSMGDIVWQNGFAFISNIIQSNDGGYVVVGSAPACFVVRKKETPLFYDAQIGIIKTDSTGAVSGCVFNYDIHTDSSFSVHDSLITFSSFNEGTAESISPTLSLPGGVLDSACYNLGGGIKENNFEATIALYPNPATNELVINGNWSSEKKSMTIFNVFGEAIYTDDFNSTLKIINCSSYPSGIYFVQIINEGRRWTGTFVKE